MKSEDKLTRPDFETIISLLNKWILIFEQGEDSSNKEKSLQELDNFRGCIVSLWSEVAELRCENAEFMGKIKSLCWAAGVR
jgi:hypothetical protein